MFVSFDIGIFLYPKVAQGFVNLVNAATLYVASKLKNMQDGVNILREYLYFHQIIQI